MKPRTCSVSLTICNDQGHAAWYSLRPLPSDELGGAPAGFFLTKQNCDPAPVYAVRVLLDGSVICNCPQFRFGDGCKHCSALVASAVLPVGLLSVLRSRTELLNKAEAEVLRIADAASEEKQVFDQDAQWRADRLGDLNEQIDRLESALAAALAANKPKRGRPRLAKAA